MSNDIENSKQLLKRALHNLPHTHPVREVQYHMRLALQKMEQLEKKEDKKSSRAQQQWNELLHTNINNPFNASQTVNIIDKMIAEEQKKLSILEVKRRTKQQEAQRRQEENSDSGTLLG